MGKNPGGYRGSIGFMDHPVCLDEHIVRSMNMDEWASQDSELRFDSSH